MFTKLLVLTFIVIISVNCEDPTIKVCKGVGCRILCPPVDTCSKISIDDCKPSEVLIPADNGCVCCDRCTEPLPTGVKCNLDRASCQNEKCESVTFEDCKKKNMAFVPATKDRCICCDTCMTVHTGCQ